MSDIANFTTKIKDFELKKQALVKSLKKDLKAAAKELFTMIPEIKSIYWTQYTPYFMDGDSCVFSMNDIIVSNCSTIFVDYPEDLQDYVDGEGEDLWANLATNPSKKHIKNSDHREVLKNFITTLYQSEDLLVEVFGDHVRVIGTKKGFRIEDFSDHH